MASQARLGKLYIQTLNINMNMRKPRLEMTSIPGIMFLEFMSSQAFMSSILKVVPQSGLGFERWLDKLTKYL